MALVIAGLGMLSVWVMFVVPKGSSTPNKPQESEIRTVNESVSRTT
jgi:hypothetical protein